MGGIGAVAEPLVVIALLLGGTWINRDSAPGRRKLGDVSREFGDVGVGRAMRLREADVLLVSDMESRPSSPSLLATQEAKWRTRIVGIWGLRREVTTPNTRRFKGYFLSRLLERFPFLVECWYWALIYWVYQLGRAVTAVWIVEGTIFAARKHALEVIAAEEYLHIFWELPIQAFFMKNQFIMKLINRIYSFIHIPGSIAFLVWLFYYTNTRSRHRNKDTEATNRLLAGSRLYESRRRTMAFCNLLAFIVFTLWPCMPPRLLSGDTTDDVAGELARSYGYGTWSRGEGSIWTENRFTNKFAAMPSLHFGYSLLIGLTIATIPLHPSPSRPASMILPFFNRSHPSLAPKVTLPSVHRFACLAVGFVYPATILVAIIATANHFILDAVAGSVICGLAWWGNGVMLNLLVLEDWFLLLVRTHKPVSVVADLEDEENYIRK